MDNSTIAAIATPLSAGGVGVIRISGTLSLDILLTVFRPYRRPQENDHENNPAFLSASTIHSHRFYHGYIVDNDQLIDEVMVVFMRSPRSYTGEDVVEIQAHSGPLVLRTIMMLLIQSGARMAGPGEFTRRAFLNGKMDLTQAEAVADIIDARTKQALDIAVNQSAGRLKSEICAIKELFVDTLVEIEAAIDFSDKTDGSMPGSEIITALQTGADRLKNLIKNHNDFSWRRTGVRVALVGAPNVGKSTLLNTFLGRERAIVAPTPGTTRDFIEETICLEGISFVFTDTAGLRNQTGDELEITGMERTRQVLSDADAVVFMVDASEGISDNDREILDTLCNKNPIIVANKADLSRSSDFLFPSRWAEAFSVLKISALKGGGLDTLKALLVGRFNEQLPTKTDADNNLLPNLRHKQSLDKAFQYVTSALTAHAEKIPEDFIAMDLRAAIDALNEITGHTTGADVLDNIFSRFCIGK